MFVFPLVALVSVPLALAGPLIVPDQVSTADGEIGVVAFQDAEFLDLGRDESQARWRVAAGILQTSNDNGASWTDAPLKNLSRPLAGDWCEVRIAGAVALVRDQFVVPFNIGDDYDLKAMAMIGVQGEQILEFGRRLIQTRPGFYVPEISVFQRMRDAAKAEAVAVFRIEDESFQYRLMSAFPISDKLVAIQTASEHPFFSSLIFFDVTKRRPIGYLPYSKVEYVAKVKAVCVAEPLTRAMDSPEQVERARGASRVISLFEGDNLNPELADTSLFGGDVAAAAPAGTKKPAAVSSSGPCR